MVTIAGLESWSNKVRQLLLICHAELTVVIIDPPMPVGESQYWVQEQFLAQVQRLPQSGSHLL